MKSQIKGYWVNNSCIHALKHKPSLTGSDKAKVLLEVQGEDSGYEATIHSLAKVGGAHLMVNHRFVPFFDELMHVHSAAQLGWDPYTAQIDAHCW